MAQNDNNRSKRILFVCPYPRDQAAGQRLKFEPHFDAFEKKGYLKEIPIKGNKTYFDTNTSSHHHFYDEDTEKLIDIDNKEIYVNKVPASPSGKSIKSVEVMVRIASDNHNQK